MNNFEAGIIKTIQSFSTGFLDGFFRVVTQFGSVWAVLGFAILFLVLFGLRGTVRYLFILGVTSLCGALIKVITARPRPFIFSVDIKNKTELAGEGAFNGFSFISGHTLTIIISVISLYVMVSRVLKDTKTVDNSAKGAMSNKKRVLIKAVLSVLLGVLTVLVGFSRIYLGVHYISDVLFAILLGFVFYYLFSFLYDKYFEKLIFKGVGKCK